MVVKGQEFLKKETKKQQELLLNFRLLRIVDKKDVLKNFEKCSFYLPYIQNFINTKEKYQELIIS